VAFSFVAEEVGDASVSPDADLCAAICSGWASETRSGMKRMPTTDLHYLGLVGWEASSSEKAIAG